MDWFEIIKTFGPNVALIVFILWRDSEREKRMATALDAAQSAHVATLINVVNTSNESRNKNSEALLTLTSKIENLPCMFEHDGARKSGGFRHLAGVPG